LSVRFLLCLLLWSGCWEFDRLLLPRDGGSDLSEIEDLSTVEDLSEVDQ
jgi:hypothetical protein